MHLYKIRKIKDKKKLAYKIKLEYENNSVFHRALMREWLCVEYYK